MDYRNMEAGEERTLTGGQWQGENQSLYAALQAHTVATAGAVLYEVEAQRDPVGVVVAYTVKRTQ